jgi:sulfur dioxygenase
MRFHSFFHKESSTFTYLVADNRSDEALLIDPVDEDVTRYLDYLRDSRLKLIVAIDTHVHADHITGLGKLRNLTQCVTQIGAESKMQCASARFSDGEALRVGTLDIRALYTPGHTDDSYSFVMPDRVFTGDTLLIGGTGRTDFQNGDPRAQYHSLFGKLLRLPEATLVYPGHDYRGNKVSTIGQERDYNPRLHVANEAEYVALMNALKLPTPKLMDIAVPANLGCGRH